MRSALSASSLHCRGRFSELNNEVSAIEAAVASCTQASEELTLTDEIEADDRVMHEDPARS